MKDLDVSTIDDEISWQPITNFVLMVRKSSDEIALVLHLAPHGDGWIMAKSVMTSGRGFEAAKKIGANQELVGEFDDLQEALAAGSLLAKKWLADPVA